MFSDNMANDSRSQWLPGTALATGVLIALRAVWKAQKKKELSCSSAVRELRSSWYIVNGLRLHVRTSNNAAIPGVLPVILVHGWGVSGSYFVPAAQMLALRFPVHVPDLPGHGLSDKPAEALDIAGLAEALSAWMDEAGIARAILIGQSMGCQIAVDLALRHPEKVDRLVLIGMTPDPHARSLLKQCGRLLAGAMYERPSLIPHLVKDYLRMGSRVLPELISLVNDPIEKKLPRISMPTMLVRGENDPLSPQSWFEEAARLLSPRRTAVIPRWGHAVQFSAPQLLTDAILPFLEEAGREHFPDRKQSESTPKHEFPSPVRVSP